MIDTFLGLSPQFCKMLIRFAICVVVSWIIIDQLYYRKSKRRDFYFTFMLISISIFFLVFFMIFVLEDMKGKAGIGLGIGLFGIFSIMRYRTDTMPVREMTYLFIIIALAVVNALASTMPLMVSATAVETAVMATRPTKLQTTLMRMAVLTLMERVPTASAMALAASVAPLTKMVPRTSAMVTARNGFCASMPRKVEKLIKSDSPRRLRASYPSYVPGCAASSASGP